VGGSLLVAWASPYVRVWRKPEQLRPVCVLRHLLHKLKRTLQLPGALRMRLRRNGCNVLVAELKAFDR